MNQVLPAREGPSDMSGRIMAGLRPLPRPDERERRCKGCESRARAYVSPKGASVSAGESSVGALLHFAWRR